MIVFPNAKINLGLRITRRRDDGYHDIETVFYPLPFHDALEIIRSASFQFNQTGISLDVGNNNLCVKAYELLKKDFPEIGAVNIHLHKAIPAGAGLGGGSADAAFTLRLLQNIFQLPVPEEQLAFYALQLGSDCPFFLVNKPAVGKGRGELLEPVDVPLKGYHLLLINPGIHIPTGWAFSHVQPQKTETSINEIISLSPEQWRNRLINDFEKPVFENHPEIARLKDWFYGQGAVYSSLSGTGSSVYGIFKGKAPSAETQPNHYRVFSCAL